MKIFRCINITLRNLSDVERNHILTWVVKVRANILFPGHWLSIDLSLNEVKHSLCSVSTLRNEPSFIHNKWLVSRFITHFKSTNYSLTRFIWFSISFTFDRLFIFQLCASLQWVIVNGNNTQLHLFRIPYIGW